MDKRWRNLGIIIVIVIFILLLYSLFNNTFLDFIAVQNKSLDQGYEDILISFENNDVNLSEFSKLNILDYDENKGIYWIVPKENVLGLKSDLLSIQNNINNYDVNAVGELNEVVEIFLEAIDIVQADYGGALQMQSLSLEGCDLDELDRVLELGKDSYLRRKDLAEKVDSFSLAYDEYSEVIEINLDEEYAGFLEVDKYVALKKEECDFS